MACTFGRRRRRSCSTWTPLRTTSPDTRTSARSSIAMSDDEQDRFRKGVEAVAKLKTAMDTNVIRIDWRNGRSVVSRVGRVGGGWGGRPDGLAPAGGLACAPYSEMLWEG